MKILKTILLCSSTLIYSAALAQSPSKSAFSVTHHDLTLELIPASGSLKAADQITVRPAKNARPNLALLLRRGLTVTAVEWGGRPLPFKVLEKADPSLFDTELDSEDIAYFGLAQVISLELPKKALQQETLTLSLKYEGIVKDSLEGADFSREYVADQITAFIGEQGVYLGPEGIYYPSLPDQIFTYSLTVTLPEAYQSVSEGADGPALIADGRRTQTWVCRQPIDGFHVTAGPYQVQTIDHQGVKISTFFFPDTTDLAANYLKACANYVSLYDSLLGPYPFEKFAVVENFFATGYGMPSFTLLGSDVIRLPFIISTSLGHEICHNWWGNSVYVDYKTGNWCEGLTTYCADYLYKERKSPQEARDYRLGLLRDYTSYAHEHNDFPLADFRERHNPAQRAVGYGKSAMLFHMMKRQIGAEAFWPALRQFYRDNAFKFASWADIQRAFEAQSGRGFQPFFDQWVKQVGAPQLAIESPELLQTDQGWQIFFILLQKQEGKPYLLDVPVKITGEAGDTTIVIHADQAAEKVALETAFRPSGFAVDPDFDLFRRLDRAEIAPTLSEVLGAPNLFVVLPSKASPEMSAAYETLAQQLNREGRYQIVKDADLQAADMQAASALFLGMPGENTAIPSSLLQNKSWQMDAAGFKLLNVEHSDPRAAMLVVERHPQNAEATVAVFGARAAADVQEAGRKLVHYGKYSYLVFYAGKNQVKGVWEATQSPLVYHF